MCFNIGVIIGPVLGGILADPVNSYPGLFGPGSFFGGKDGVWWMQHWPFALPNLLSAVFIFASFTAVFLGLDEVDQSLTSPACPLTLISLMRYGIDPRSRPVQPRLGSQTG